MSDRQTFNEVLEVLNHLDKLGVLEKLHRSKILCQEAYVRRKIANAYNDLLGKGSGAMHTRCVLSKLFDVSENSIYRAQKSMRVIIGPINIFSLKQTSGMAMVNELIDKGILNFLYKGSVINSSIFTRKDIYSYYSELIKIGLSNGVAIQQTADKFDNFRSNISYALSMLRELNDPE